MFIPIAPGIAFDPREAEESFIRASGPGGQSVDTFWCITNAKRSLWHRCR